MAMAEMLVAALPYKTLLSMSRVCTARCTIPNKLRICNYPETNSCYYPLPEDDSSSLTFLVNTLGVEGMRKLREKLSPAFPAKEIE